MYQHCGTLESTTGDLFRVFVREKHTKWATSIKIIKACLNETYQETIRMTPYEAQFGKKPTRDWEKYVYTSVVDNEKADLSSCLLYTSRCV